uniref:Sperm microtubule inner protein 5 n=1 Tax=Chelonoidis abingdonii TaxID=106734 RepID=A0A8C0IK19_CHEAB
MTFPWCIVSSGTSLQFVGPISSGYFILRNLIMVEISRDAQNELRYIAASTPKLPSICSNEDVLQALYDYNYKHHPYVLGTVITKRSLLEPPIPGWTGFVPRARVTELGYGVRYHEMTKNCYQDFKTLRDWQAALVDLPQSCLRRVAWSTAPVELLQSCLRTVGCSRGPGGPPAGMTAAAPPELRSSQPSAAMTAAAPPELQDQLAGLRNCRMPRALKPLAQVLDRVHLATQTGIKI